MELLALDLTPYLDRAINILYVALGLGLVIFFHELGHFAVAKWCDVNVERFSIGFGPILWSRKRGETEYALSAIPFGGYVKMLGQDDMDPSQLSSEEIAQDPRSYSAKPVWMRMAIISAGVIMNVVTAVIFYAIAFGFGIEEPTPDVGSLQVGMPAWVAGLQTGDRIQKINGHPIESYDDIVMEVAISRGPLDVEVKRRDGTDSKLEIMPNEKEGRRRLGFTPTSSLTLISDPKKEISPVVPETPAAAAQPPFQAGDTIKAIDGTPVESYAGFYDLLCRKANKTIVLDVEREKSKEKVAIKVDPNLFRTLGVQFEIGKVAAVQAGSPAEKEGLQTGDRITKIDGKAVGTEIDPLRLPDYFYNLASGPDKREVKISYIREMKGGAPEEKECHLMPLDKPAWAERPDAPNEPIAIPAIGLAYRLVPSVLNIDENGPAKDLLQKGDLIKSMQLVLPQGAEAEDPAPKPEYVTFEFSDDSKNLEHAIWAMQLFPKRDAELVVRRNGKDEKVTITPKRAEAEGWYMPIRGVQFNLQISPIRAANFVDSVAKGAAYTRKTLIQMYLTLRNLFTGHLSFTELGGPIRIAQAAYYHAEGGLPMLSLFLGLLSVNLAVLNFLPIPVLDGGHMVFLIWEAVTRKKPSERVLVAATYVGMAFVLGLMITVICLDIFVKRGG